MGKDASSVHLRIHWVDPTVPTAFISCKMNTNVQIDLVVVRYCTSVSRSPRLGRLRTGWATYRE